MPPIELGFHPEQNARRRAQLARLRNLSALQGEAPTQSNRATIVNTEAHRIYLRLCPLLYPASIKQLETKGVTSSTLNTLRAITAYYRDRAYDLTGHNHQMEEERKIILENIRSRLTHKTESGY